MLILIVEDNDLQMKIISNFLLGNNYRVLTANNAFDAWQKANKEIPDLILLDIMMPGMSGQELCKRFKSNKKFTHIPIIFLTALGNKENIIKGLSLGAADYIAKPFDKEELMARLSVHLELKKSNDIILEQNNLLKLELERRRIAEENFKLFFIAVNTSPVMVLITDKNATIDYVNPSFISTTGFSAKELLGKKIFDIYTEISNSEDYISSLESISKGVDWQGDILTKKKNGDAIWERMSVSSIKNDNGEIIHIVFLITDITEEKKHITEINKYNKELVEINATKDKFFTIIAHDLKNPLSVLISSSEIMANSEFNLSINEFQKFSKEISNSSRKLYELLENLLTWTRSQTGRIEYNPEFIRLNDFAINSTSVLKNNAKNKNININYNIPNEIEVYCDFNMISTVFRNLVSNAIKYTPNNGKIEITVDKYLTSPINNLKYVQISVNDTGIGISEEGLKKIFRIDEKYSTAGTNKEKGTGLGLIVCKEFIDKHNGEIWAESKNSDGTKFKFTLPIENGIINEIIL